jgi:DNA-binding transcriptional LysR family regulator
MSRSTLLPSIVSVDSRGDLSGADYGADVVFVHSAGEIGIIHGMNISSIDLNLLLVFDALLRDRNVTVAANRIGISQPAMSNALARLRKTFGDRLFVRTVRGMEPTPYAEQLAVPLRGACELVAKALALDAGFDASTSKRSFTFYMTDIGEIVFLPALLERLARLAPGIGVKVVRIPQRNLQEAMVSGDVDLAVGSFPTLKAGFFQQRLYKDSFVCVARANHPILRKTITRKQYLEATHAIVESAGTGHQAAIEKLLAEQHANLKIGLVVPHFLSLPLIVAQTDHLITIPRRMAAAFEGSSAIRVFEPPLKFPSIDIKQHWHERVHHDAANRWMRALIAEIFLV